MRNSLNQKQTVLPFSFTSDNRVEIAINLYLQRAVIDGDHKDHTHERTGRAALNVNVLEGALYVIVHQSIMLATIYHQYNYQLPCNLSVSRVGYVCFFTDAMFSNS